MPVPLWQSNIQDCPIKDFPRNQRNCFSSSLRRFELVPGPFQSIDQKLPDVRVVVHDKNSSYFDGNLVGLGNDPL